MFIGRAGSGKSEFCLNEMLKKENKDKQIYIITPEQFSYTQEKKLLEKSKKSILNIEVLSFNRLAYKIDLELGKNLNHNLTNARKSYDYKTSNRKKEKSINIFK